MRRQTTLATPQAVPNKPVIDAEHCTMLLKGKCGICEYEDVCGGERGRANGVSGDHRASDPACVYIPNSIRLIQ